MNLIEFIGFIITMIAMFAILVRRSMEERKRRKDPEAYEREEEEREKALREFLRNLDVDVEEPKKKPASPPPAPAVTEESPKPKARPSRTVRDNYEFASRIKQYEETKGVQSRVFETEIGQKEFDEIGQEIVTGDLFMQPGLGAYEIGQPSSGTSRGAKILKRLERPSDIVIYHEILAKPRGHQKNFLPHDLSE